MNLTAAPARVCPGCGSTIAGPLDICPRCTTSLTPPSQPTRPKRHWLRRTLTTLALIPGIAGLGITAWQFTHHTNSHRAAIAAAPKATTVTVAQPKTTITAAPATTLPAARFQSCTSQSGGYTVQYPLGWVTESATPAQACHFFGARPFGVIATDLADGDITIDTSTRGSYNAFVAAFAEPGDADITLHYKPLTINRHRAEQMNVTVHVGAHITYGYGYVIDHHNKPLIITTPSQHPRSPTLQRIVTRMAHSLQLR